MTTLAQAARLTGRGKTILARLVSGGYSRAVKKTAFPRMRTSRRASTHSLLLSRLRQSCALVSLSPMSALD